MNNQLNNDYDENLSWSESPDFLNQNNENEEKDKGKKGILIALIKATSMMVLALVVLIFVTIAWFALNREIENGGMGLETATLPFYLRVKENSNDSYFSRYFHFFNLADDTYTEGTSEIVGLDTYYTTEDGEGKIVWRLNADDLDEDTNIYTVGLNPGTSGKLEFEIVPTRTGPLTIDFHFDVRGFTAEYPTDEEIYNLEYESGDVKSMTEIIPFSGSGTETDSQKALSYIGGHLLFFENFDDDTDRYTGFLGDEDNTFHFSIANATEGTAIPVTIYYIWTNTIDQLILETGECGMTDIPLVADDSDERNALVGYVNSHKNTLFSSGNLLVPDVTHDSYAGNETLRINFNNYYNAADQIIGVNLDYILIDMNAVQQ